MLTIKQDNLYSNPPFLFFCPLSHSLPHPRPRGNHIQPLFTPVASYIGICLHVAKISRRSNIINFVNEEFSSNTIPCFPSLNLPNRVTVTFQSMRQTLTTNNPLMSYLVSSLLALNTHPPPGPTWPYNLLFNQWPLGEQSLELSTRNWGINRILSLYILFFFQQKWIQVWLSG